MTVESRNTTEKYGVVSASKIIGEAVVNRQNEDLGKIHELVINAKEGRVAYAVLSFGGFIGIYADSSTKAKAIFEEAKHQAKELKKDADLHLAEARQKVN